MPYLKHFSNMCVLCTVLACALPLQAEQTLSSCLDEGKIAYTNQNYPQAEQIFERCLTLDPQNVDAHLSLGGVYLTQDKLDVAQSHFQTALTHMQRNSPYWSYTYSMLGDIALKNRQNKQALALYSQSLQYNAANVNSLVGKGAILETQGDTQGAAEAYTSALAVEPLNLIARRRLIVLEPEYLTDDDILIALKQRLAVKPEETTLTDENRTLFFRMHQAEQRRGVDYLKNKFGRNLPKDYIVTLNQGTDFARELLTLDGFNALEKSIGQDAVLVFRRLNIPIQSIFSLRNKEGKPVFTPETTLTEEGFTVYTQALAGQKSYLLPNQAVPPSPAQLKKVQARAQALLKKGYTEISRAEYKMLENKTLCSDDTLKNKLGMYFLPVAKNLHRYFVRTTDTDPLQTVPYYYVMQARHKRNPKVEVPKNELIEYYQYYGYTLCLSDGNLTLAEDSADPNAF